MKHYWVITSKQLSRLSIHETEETAQDTKREWWLDGADDVEIEKVPESDLNDEEKAWLGI